MLTVSEYATLASSSREFFPKKVYLSAHIDTPSNLSKKSSHCDPQSRLIFFERISLTPSSWIDKLTQPRVVGCLPNAVLITRSFQAHDHHPIHTVIQLVQVVPDKPPLVSKTLLVHEGFSNVVSASLSPQMDLLAFTVSFPLSDGSIGYDAFLVETTLLPSSTILPFRSTSTSFPFICAIFLPTTSSSGPMIKSRFVLAGVKMSRFVTATCITTIKTENKYRQLVDLPKMTSNFISSFGSSNTQNSLTTTWFSLLSTVNDSPSIDLGLIVSDEGQKETMTFMMIRLDQSEPKLLFTQNICNFHQYFNPDPPVIPIHNSPLYTSPSSSTIQLLRLDPYQSPVSTTFAVTSVIPSSFGSVHRIYDCTLLIPSTNSQISYEVKTNNDLLELPYFSQLPNNLIALVNPSVCFQIIDPASCVSLADVSCLSGGGEVSLYRSRVVDGLKVKYCEAKNGGFVLLQGFFDYSMCFLLKDSVIYSVKFGLDSVVQSLEDFDPADVPKLVHLSLFHSNNENRFSKLIDRICEAFPHYLTIATLNEILFGLAYSNFKKCINLEHSHTDNQAHADVSNLISSCLSVIPITCLTRPSLMKDSVEKGVKTSQSINSDLHSHEKSLTFADFAQSIPLLESLKLDFLKNSTENSQNIDDLASETLSMKSLKSQESFRTAFSPISSPVRSSQRRSLDTSGSITSPRSQTPRSLKKSFVPGIGLKNVSNALSDFHLPNSVPLFVVSTPFSENYYFKKFKKNLNDDRKPPRSPYKSILNQQSNSLTLTNVFEGIFSWLTRVKQSKHSFFSKRKDYSTFISRMVALYLSRLSLAIDKTYSIILQSISSSIVKFDILESFFSILKSNLLSIPPLMTSQLSSLSPRVLPKSLFFQFLTFGIVVPPDGLLDENREENSNEFQDETTVISSPVTSGLEQSAVSVNQSFVDESLTFTENFTFYDTPQSFRSPVSSGDGVGFQSFTTASGQNVTSSDSSLSFESFDEISVTPSPMVNNSNDNKCENLSLVSSLSCSRQILSSFSSHSVPTPSQIEGISPVIASSDPRTDLVLLSKLPVVGQIFPQMSSLGSKKDQFWSRFLTLLERSGHDVEVQSSLLMLNRYLLRFSDTFSQSKSNEHGSTPFVYDHCFEPVYSLINSVLESDFLEIYSKLEGASDYQILLQRFKKRVNNLLNLEESERIDRANLVESSLGAFFDLDSLLEELS
ncbi:hypothetical protein P9112_012623 [Eukaryota sp. TZLM1-RC]